jgi:hypothetical protein
MSKLHEKPSALKREHPALQKRKFINFFLFLWVIFALLVPDTDPGNPIKSGSTTVVILSHYLPMQNGFPTVTACAVLSRKVCRNPVRPAARCICPHRRHYRLENLRTLILADNLLREIALHTAQVRHPFQFFQITKA